MDFQANSLGFGLRISCWIFNFTIGIIFPDDEMQLIQTSRSTRQNRLNTRPIKFHGLIRNSLMGHLLQETLDACLESHKYIGI